MKKYIHPIILSIITMQIGFSQSVLENYIHTGFSENQSLQQEQMQLEKSIYALQEAKTLFLPNVSFRADYFLAGGGRTVDFPAGDLLNPVYGTLNQLTNSSSFPQLANQSILLNPNNFYDAKFRTTLPLLNLEIEYNRRIKKDQVDLQRIEIDLYKRELLKEIKTAYFKYLQAMEAIKIFDNALELLRESKRINDVLFMNEKVNRTAVLRSENEITKFDALRENAVQNANSAKSYFNFLLNRNLSDAIEIDTSYQSAALTSNDNLSGTQREELQQLQVAGTINQHLNNLTKSFIVPKLSAFLDLGSQGFDWQFDNKTRYYFFGISLQWDLFSGGKNYYKTKQVQMDQKMLESQTKYVEQQLQLQLTTAVNQFNAALYTYQAASASFQTAQKFYTDVLRQYKQGQALFIELLDAQNQWVQAELQINITLFDTYIQAAQIERANASYNLNDHPNEK